MTYVFVSFRPPYLCPWEGHKHGVSIQSLINLSKTFLRISPARNIAQTWTFVRLFEYSSSFISLILEFICWMVLMMVWQWKPAIYSILLFYFHLIMTFWKRRNVVPCFIIFYRRFLLSIFLVIIIIFTPYYVEKIGTHLRTCAQIFLVEMIQSG